MVSKFCVCRDADQSKALFSAVALVARSFGALAAFDGDSHLERHDDWLAWGDESICASMLRDGQACGTTVAARKGRLLVYVVLGGVPVLEQDSLRRLLVPWLARLEMQVQ